jgi:uncharacterized protein
MSWTQTHSGRKFDLLNPTPDMVEWGDVGHALANLCRFNGHTRFFYSVAEHSMLVEELARRCPTIRVFNPQRALLALLHDAHEAYLGDMTTPVAHALDLVGGFAAVGGMKALKDRADRAIFAKAGLTPEDVARWMPEVKRADSLSLMIEREQIMALPPEPWAQELEDLVPEARKHGRVNWMERSVASHLFTTQVQALVSVVADLKKSKLPAAKHAKA